MGTAHRARTAYAAGWARSGGPLTSRVRLGAEIAIQLAVECGAAPGVVEATLQLGALEGVWARIYDRRDALYTRHDRAVRAAWHDYTRRELDVPALVGAVRAAAGLTEARGDSAADRQRRADRRAKIIAVVLAALLLLLRRPDKPRYTALLGAVENALRDGVAEGTADAVAVAAEKTGGYTAVDLDRAFADARANTGEHLDAYQAQAQAWLKTMTTAAAHDLGRRLDQMVEDDQDAEEMAAEIQETGTGSDTPAVPTTTDQVVGTGLAIGMLAVFGVLSVNTVEWVTVGDGRVCGACQAREDSSPYPLFNAARPPEHPHCRCILTPAGPITSLRQFGDYLIGGSP